MGQLRKTVDGFMPNFADASEFNHNIFMEALGDVVAARECTASQTQLDAFLWMAKLVSTRTAPINSQSQKHAKNFIAFARPMHISTPMQGQDTPTTDPSSLPNTPPYTQWGRCESSVRGHSVKLQNWGAESRLLIKKHHFGSKSVFWVV